MRKTNSTSISGIQPPWTLSWSSLVRPDIYNKLQHTKRVVINLIINICSHSTLYNSNYIYFIIQYWTCLFIHLLMTITKNIECKQNKMGWYLDFWSITNLSLLEKLEANKGGRETNLVMICLNNMLKRFLCARGFGCSLIAKYINHIPWISVRVC